MEQKKLTLPIVPDGWPQPAFALGEKVWDKAASYLYEPYDVIGMSLNQHPGLGGDCFWVYTVAAVDEGDYSCQELLAVRLTREPLPEWQAPPMDRDDPDDPDDPFRNSPDVP